ncbi:hypothetical protein EXIGLDRAFT_762075 [Exidia glandulosa HHB12029]|uniref:Uncharacterized protein n=1 Tax=Exidia glandulosa HHB12029 TaxID=1314781 RepID=A0A165MZ67_EXIGL|nr:hypothetical protein EXIGLDRAFT_762075 [Exidia glandulosa HHB12029]
MPHKRAKRSKREQEKQARSADCAPTVSASLDAEDVPKSIARILNAESVQKKYQQDKKRQREEEVPDKPAKRAKTTSTKLKIMPGESMANFNRRVEDSLRPAVQAARQTARVPVPQSKSKPRRADSDASDDDVQPERKPATAPTRQAEPKEFAKATSVSRVRDVVQAPPSFANDKFSKRAKSKLGGQGTSKTTDVVSPAHQRMMELEREKAIAHYRALKASKAAAAHSS